MNTSDQIFVAILFGLGWLVAPASLIWGWVRWLGRPKRWTITSFLALFGFLLAMASALVAICSILYSEAIGGFPFYDPLLMKIIRIGSLLAVSGFVAGLGGVWRPNSLRWLTPISALGMFAFWIGVEMTE
jgi:hypothetical protein